MEDTFLQIAAILLIATVAGAVFTRFKQPLIVAFIAVGVLVGPVGLDWVQPARWAWRTFRRSTWRAP